MVVEDLNIAKFWQNWVYLSLYTKSIKIIFWHEKQPKFEKGQKLWKEVKDKIETKRSNQERQTHFLFLKSYLGLNKMLFFWIVFVLYFFKLSGKSGCWKTAIIHFVSDDVWLQKGEGVSNICEKMIT